MSVAHRKETFFFFFFFFFFFLGIEHVNLLWAISVVPIVLLPSISHRQHRQHDANERFHREAGIEESHQRFMSITAMDLQALLFSHTVSMDLLPGQKQEMVWGSLQLFLYPHVRFIPKQAKWGEYKRLGLVFFFVYWSF